MAEQAFEIDITDQSVNVRLDVSTASPRTRFYWCIFFIALGALGICLLLVRPGSHGDPSMWHDLSTSPVDSGNFLVPLVLVLSFPVFVGLISWRWVVMAYPSDESFHCDRSTLTISRVRWLDIHNKDWETRSYPLADIEKIRYQALASAKGSSIYGLRFLAGGKTQRVLPGITPRQADKVLKALKALGADVSDDPEFSKRLEEDKFWHKD
ncbi:MAG TPA: hypothetical protein VLM42_12650 [Bryobacteraceae bacterium]|nr:hypothetical protein [Bryobacteraceae bacterium]